MPWWEERTTLSKPNLRKVQRRVGGFETTGQVQKYIVLGQGQPASFLEDCDQHLEALVFKARAVALGLAKIGR